MSHAEHTVTVNRPAGAIFDYLADGTHNAEWRSGVLEIERTSPGNGQGATYRQVLSGPGGRQIDGDYQVTAGPARPSGMFELTETTPGTTTVRFTLDLRPSGLMKLLTPMIARQVRHEVAQLDTLKTVLERTS
jgi:hypothetical protein